LKTVKIQSLVEALLLWFAANARDLPWRRTRDPYVIWVSEIMLQQTQVKTVIPFWERWMRELPTIQAAANASSGKLHKLWEGLGYYTRVRNLQKAAMVIVQQHDGKFPETFSDVLALPGIGRYTAGAICSIAFNHPTPILDGNVIRVLTRVFGIAENPKEKLTNTRLWTLAGELVRTAGAPHFDCSRRRAEAQTAGAECGVRSAESSLSLLTSAPTSAGNCSALNQSLMELGALVCTPRNAQCLLCPLKKMCVAFREGRVEALPNLGRREPVTARRYAAFVVERDGKFLVRQRPAGVVNAHLWEFPNVELKEGPASHLPGERVSTSSQEARSKLRHPFSATKLLRPRSDGILAAAKELFGIVAPDLSPLITVKHSITRYRITLEAFRVNSGWTNFPPNAGLWKTPAQLRQLAFTSAHRKVLRAVSATGLLVLAVVFCGLLMAVKVANAAEDRHMVLEGLQGDVTTNEYQSFIDKLNFQPPPPSNNIGTVMVYESAGGAKLHGMQTFYSFTHDRRALDLAIVWADAFLHARNDSVNGRMVWTGKRELCWPNKETNDEAHVLYSGTENGDVIEHIVNTAKLILESPSLWKETAPADKFNFGATYFDRAKTYVRECQRSTETTIVPWYVRSTKDGYRLIHPDSPVYYQYCESKGPVPWNQQQFIVGGLLRLAQCHRLLNDGNTNIAYYEKITGDAADWFFSNAKLVSIHGTNCYDWGYVPVNDPEEHREDTGHSFYDVYVLRAYQANLGPTRIQMQRLINTALFVINRGNNRFGGYVNGVTNQYRPEREYLNYQWIEMSVLDKRLYELTGNAVLASHEYFFNLQVEAAMLYAKHYWATSAPEPPVLDGAIGVPPLEKSSARPARRIPPPEILGAFFGLSELLLTLFKRSGKKAVSKDRHSLKLIWLVNTTAIVLGIAAAYRLHSCQLPWPNVTRKAGYGLFVLGMALRWYSVLYLGRFFTTNVAIAANHRVIDSGPYRFIRHPSYAGALLAVFGFGLTFQNWACLLIIFAPCCAVNLWRIHIEEQALLEALGESYQNYLQRTKRLIPVIY